MGRVSRYLINPNLEETLSTFVSSHLLGPEIEIESSKSPRASPCRWNAFHQSNLKESNGMAAKNYPKVKHGFPFPPCFVGCAPAAGRAHVPGHSVGRLKMFQSPALSSARGQLFLNRLNWVPDRCTQARQSPGDGVPSRSVDRRSYWRFNSRSPGREKDCPDEMENLALASSFSSMRFGFEISEATKRIAVRPRRRTMTWEIDTTSCPAWVTKVTNIHTDCFKSSWTMRYLLRTAWVFIRFVPKNDMSCASAPQTKDQAANTELGRMARKNRKVWKSGNPFLWPMPHACNTSGCSLLCYWTASQLWVRGPTTCSRQLGLGMTRAEWLPMNSWKHSMSEGTQMPRAKLPKDALAAWSTGGRIIV